MRVPFDPATGATGAPALLLRTPHRVADVRRDGRRLLAFATPVETAPRRVRVVANWMTEIRRWGGEAGFPPPPPPSAPAGAQRPRRRASAPAPIDSPRDHPPPNRLTLALADRYRLERELGQGGMATVYLAEDLKHRRKVAIKVLRPELAAVIGAERFLREIQTIATLQHPHILGLIDSGEVNGTAYYVMPFVDGESLRDRLRRETPAPGARRGAPGRARWPPPSTTPTGTA